MARSIHTRIPVLTMQIQQGTGA